MSHRSAVHDALQGRKECPDVFDREPRHRPHDTPAGTTTPGVPSLNRVTRSAVRPAVPADLPGILDVYNLHVEGGTATFDLEPVTVDDRRSWFGRFSTDGPHRLLVADIAGLIAGFAASTPFRDREGYRHTVETTVYVHPEHQGAGLGIRLMMELIAAIDRAGVHRAVAAISLPNEPSIRLHERLGYRPVGTMSEVGRKFDRWIDVAWYLREGHEA